MHSSLEAEGIGQDMDRTGSNDTADLRQQAGTEQGIFRSQRHAPDTWLQTFLTDQPSAGTLHIFHGNHTGILRRSLCIPITESKRRHTFHTEFLCYGLSLRKTPFIT